LRHLPGRPPRLHLPPPRRAGRLSFPAGRPALLPCPIVERRPWGGAGQRRKGAWLRAQGSELGAAQGDKLGLRHIMSPLPLCRTPAGAGWHWPPTARAQVVRGRQPKLQRRGFGWHWARRAGGRVSRSGRASARSGPAGIGEDRLGGGPGQQCSLAGGIAWPAAVLGGTGRWVGREHGIFFFLFNFFDFLVDLTGGSQSTSANYRR
jgi:hypothetical protein